MIFFALVIKVKIRKARGFDIRYKYISPTHFSRLLYCDKIAAYKKKNDVKYFDSCFSKVSET